MNQNRSKCSRRWLWLLLPFYLLASGPIAWATNNGYLPTQIQLIYLPLYPLLKIDCLHQLFFHYTVVIWGGFPSGYTTL